MADFIKLHIVNHNSGTALCSSTLSLQFKVFSVRAGDVPKKYRCMRPGCRRGWNDANRRAAEAEKHG